MTDHVSSVQAFRNMLADLGPETARSVMDSEIRRAEQRIASIRDNAARIGRFSDPVERKWWIAGRVAEHQESIDRYKYYKSLID